MLTIVALQFVSLTIPFILTQLLTHALINEVLPITKQQHRAALCRPSRNRGFIADTKRYFTPVVTGVYAAFILYAINLLILRT